MIFNRYAKLPLIKQIFQNYFLQTSKMSSKPKLYVTRGDLSENVLKLLNETCDIDAFSKDDVAPREEFLKGVAGKDAILCQLTDKVDAELLDAAGPNLKVVGTVSVGYDHIDVNECQKRGIKVGYTPGVLTEATADLTVALLLAAARRIVEASKEVTGGGWRIWHPFWMCGQELSDSTVGFVGLGRIGQAVLKRLAPFGVSRFVYCGRQKRAECDLLGAEFVDFDQLLKESDFVLVCCSLNDSTRNLFNRDAFSKMKSNAIFVNTSRGLIVDQDALYDALHSRQIWAAGIDVTHPEPLPSDHKLTTLSNCVILPHIGSSTEKTRNKMVMLTVENVLAALNGKEMPARLC